MDTDQVQFPGSGGINPEGRHRAAVANSLARAQSAADLGFYDEALAWLEVVETVDGELPDDWQTRWRDWRLRLSGYEDVRQP